MFWWILVAQLSVQMTSYGDVVIRLTPPVSVRKGSSHCGTRNNRYSSVMLSTATRAQSFGKARYMSKQQRPHEKEGWAWFPAWDLELQV